MRRGQLIGTVSLMCSFSHLSSASLTTLRSGFPDRFILDPFCSKVQIILVPFFHFVRIAEVTRPNSRHTSSFFFSIFYWLYLFKFSSTFISFLLFITVAMLSRFQSSAHCRIRHVGGIFIVVPCILINQNSFHQQVHPFIKHITYLY